MHAIAIKGIVKISLCFFRRTVKAWRHGAIFQAHAMQQMLHETPFRVATLKIVATIVMRSLQHQQFCCVDSNLFDFLQQKFSTNLLHCKKKITRRHGAKIPCACNAI